jgi:hypothetical protein
MRAELSLRVVRDHCCSDHRMQLSADALRFVLAQGLPAVIEVSGGSMSPTIAKGTKVDVAPLGEADDPAVGDIVLLATSGDVLILHRVMAAFVEGGQRFIVHQGDAASSTFGISARRDVLARMTGFAGDARSVPTPSRLDATAGAIFLRRRAACVAFVGARRLARVLHVSERGLVRQCARAFRRIARVVTG